MERTTTVPRWRRALIGVATVAVLGGFAQSGGASAASAKPKSGGTLTIGIFNEIPTMDPVRGTVGSLSTGGDRVTLVMGTLLNINTRTGAILPGLAESLDTTDGLTWTLKLRPNLKFSDGTPFDADAVIFHFNRLKDPANAYQSISTVAQISKMTAIDPRTVEFKLANANGSFGQIFTDTAGSVPSPAAVKADPRNWGQKPIGAGPFLLKEWVRDQQYTFVRNPDYFDKPRPYLDSIVMKIIPNQQTLANSFQAGEVDVVHGAANATILNVALKDPKTFRAFDPANMPGAVGAACNLERTPCQDVRFREAMSLAFDYKAAKEIFLADIPAPAKFQCAPWGVGSPFCAREIFQKYNPDKARKLVDAVKADGINTDLVYTFNSDSTSGTAHGEYVQQSLSKIGIKTTLRAVSTNEYTQLVTRHDFQAAIVFNPTRTDMPARYYNDWHSVGGPNGGRDTPNLNNAALDVALEKGRNSVKLADRIDGMQEAQRIIANQHLVMWIVPQFLGNLSRHSLQLPKYVSPDAASYRYEEAWIKGNK